MPSPRRTWAPLHRPGIILWLLAAIAVAAAGYNDPLPTRLLVGLLLALPALLRIAFLAGRRGLRAGERCCERPRRVACRRRDSGIADPRDPLSNPWVARSVTGLILSTAAAALTLSLVSGAPRSLPDVALSSPALLHLQRTAVATIAVALLMLFAVRAMMGYFPRTLSTTSIEWPAATAVAESTQASQSAASGVHGLAVVVEKLGAWVSNSGSH